VSAHRFPNWRVAVLTKVPRKCGKPDRSAALLARPEARAAQTFDPAALFATM